MRLIFFSFGRLRVIMGHHSSERGGNGVRVSGCLDALHGSPKRISLQQHEQQLCGGRVVDPPAPLPPAVTHPSCLSPPTTHQILDCRNATSSSCAAGGWPTTALDYMVDATLTWGGLASDSGYAYTQKDGKCNRGKVQLGEVCLGEVCLGKVCLGERTLTRTYYKYEKQLLVKACTKLCSSFPFSLQHSFPPLFLHLSLPPFSLHLSFPPLSLHLSLFPLSLHLSLFPLSLHLFLFPLSLHLFFFPLSLHLSPSPSPVHASLPPSSPGHMQRRRVCSGGGGGSQCGGDGVQLNVIGRRLLDPPQLLGGHVGHAGRRPSHASHRRTHVGGGTCEEVMDRFYTCSCLDPLFIPVADKGGAQTCVFVNVCSQQDENPCAVGTCINDKAGGFFCLCPPGFDQGYRPNGAHTCVPTYNPSYTVIFPIDISCPLVYQLYGLTEEAFLAQNPNLLCVAKGSGGGDVPTLPMCTAWYTVHSRDTCESIMKDFALNQTTFFSLNPGVGCDSLFASVGGSSLGWSGGGVQVREWQQVRGGEEKMEIIILFASVGSSSLDWSGGGVQVSGGE
ncbi:unnamed protein product [Closterium sp. NIES-65]|nr:unnamed protein product [Closterium sp. NIES-65]